MTSKVNPSVKRPANAWQTAGAIAYGGHVTGDSNGFIVPGSSPTPLSTQDSTIDETALNGFQESHSDTSLTVTINPGEGFIFGSWTVTDTATDVTLAASTSGQTIYVGWDRTSADDVIIGLDSAFTATASDTDQKIPLWTANTNGNGVTSITDERTIGSPSPIGSTEDDGTITIESDDGSDSITIAPDGSVESLSLTAETLDVLGDVTDDSGNLIYDYSEAAVPVEIISAISASNITDVSADSAANAHHEAFEPSDYTPEEDTHNKTTSASDLSDVSADSAANAHHEAFEPSDYNPQEDTSYSTFSGSHTDLSDVGSSDHHSKTSSASDLTDVSADSNSSAHHSKTSSASELTDVSADSNSNAHHSKTSSASELTDVSADSLANAHHEVFEPSDYTPESDTHSKTTSASELSGVSADSVSNAHHEAFEPSDYNPQEDTSYNTYNFWKLADGNSAQAVTDLEKIDFTGGAGIETNIADPNGPEMELEITNTQDTSSFNGSHNDLTDIGSSDHHSKTSSASELSDVSADSDSDAHHTRYDNAEARSAIDNTERVLEQLNILGELSGEGIAISGRKNPNALYKFYDDGTGTQRHAENWYDGSTYHLLETTTNGIELDGSPIFRETDYNPESDTHNKTTSSSELTDVSADSNSSAHHSKYTDSDAQNAVNTFSGSHTDLSNVGSSDHHSKTTSASDLSDVSADSNSNAHHSKYTDSDARSAVNTFSGSHNDLSNVGSSDHHSKTTSASELTDVSADSNSNAHHEVFEPSDYNPQDDTAYETFSGSHNDLFNVGSSDHHSKTSSASELTDVSADSVSNAHHTQAVPAYQTVDDAPTDLAQGAAVFIKNDGKIYIEEDGPTASPEPVIE